MVQEGKALTQERGGSVGGDAPGQPWWTAAECRALARRGAGRGRVQLTIYDGDVKWLEPVTDEQYKAPPKIAGCRQGLGRQALGPVARGHAAIPTLTEHQCSRTSRLAFFGSRYRGCRRHASSPGARRRTEQQSSPASASVVTPVRRTRGRPAPDVLRRRSPEAILSALTAGGMRPQGGRLTGAERRAVAEYSRVASSAAT